MARTDFNVIKFNCYEFAGVSNTRQLKQKFSSFDFRKPSEWQRLLSALMMAIAEDDS